MLPRNIHFDHVVMNLPAFSLEFIPDLVSALRGKQSSHPNKPADDLPLAKKARECAPSSSTIIHCYLFARTGEDPLQVDFLSMIISIDDTGYHWASSTFPAYFCSQSEDSLTFKKYVLCLFQSVSLIN